HLREGLSIFADARDLSGITLLLEDFAWLAEAGGYRDRAVRLGAAAEELARQTGTDIFGTGRESSGLPDPRVWVTDDPARALWAEGETMTVDEAVAYALKEE
ncbi:MAG TPA: hypothetical protein VFH81_05535, partial [Actinomycetota bacterium]|nr:hypothetical protein [Actinomycetota bacterium]